jgi:predicted nucleic acid-binding protein
MILLDTNVISALMRPHIDPAVAAYLQTRPADTLFTASLCEAEIRYGIARLPAGRRRDGLAVAFQTFLAEGFAGRIIAFDSACAAAYADIRVRREAAGRPVAIPDAMIAGTALAYGATVATRNTGDFADCGILVENPWDVA